jgi:hypothetical protein
VKRKAKPKARRKLGANPPLGELAEAEAAGGELPAEVQAAIEPFARLFRDITRTLHKPGGPGAPDVAAGPRALGLAMALVRPTAASSSRPRPEAKSSPRKRYGKADYEVFFREILDLRAKGKEAEESIRIVARKRGPSYTTLRRRFHGRGRR